LLHYLSFLFAITETHLQERDPAQNKDLKRGTGVKMYKIQAIFKLLGNWNSSYVEAIGTPIFVTLYARIKAKTWFTWILCSTTITAPILAIFTVVIKLHFLRAILTTYILVVDRGTFILIILVGEYFGVGFFQKEKLICCIHEI
jgi:hypothetical protein